MKNIPRFVFNKNLQLTAIYLSLFVFFLFDLHLISIDYGGQRSLGDSKDYGGSHVACTQTMLEVSLNETFFVGCKPRPQAFKLYYCKLTVVLINDKKVECLFYTDKYAGYQLVLYNGYCEDKVITTYAKQIGNGAKGGCGFEVDASKTNIGRFVLRQHLSKSHPTLEGL